MSEQQPWVYKPKTPEEIEALAWDIEAGRVFGSWSCPPDMIRSCFMILAFMEATHLQSLKDNNICHVYEYMDKAGPRGINGYPSFFSAQYLNQDDITKIMNRLKEIEAFRKGTGPKA
jgi:hypothetical protein